MLELRPNCERCSKKLPPDSLEAMICTFECTFCVNCVDNILHNVCPNCGGNFEQRPIRPKVQLKKYPSSESPVVKSINEKTFQILKRKNMNVNPEDR